MFPRPRRKKQNCATSTSKSKLKPLPSIISGKKIDNSSVCPKSRKSMVTPKFRASRSISSVENGSKSLSSRPARRPGSQGIREISCNFKSFGRSSDMIDEDPIERSMLPDPYAEMETNVDSAMPLDPNAPWWLFLAEMRLQARRQAVKLENKSDVKMDNRLDGKPDEKSNGSKTKTEKGQIDFSKLLSTCQCTNAAAGGEPRSSPVVVGGAEPAIRNKEEGAGEDDNNDNDDEDDEEDDEAGLPQAVRAMQSKPCTPSAREVMRERHKARMEEIARSVDQADLLDNLRSSGFFYYDYSNHIRTTSNNHNLKNGKKKGIERLLQLLSFKSTRGASDLYGI